MAPLSEETRALMEELEQQAFGAVPEGVQHLIIEAAEEPITHNDEGNPRLRVSYRVVCGEHEDSYVSDFVGLYAAEHSDSKKSFEQRSKAARAMGLGALASIAKVSGSQNASDVVAQLSVLNLEEDMQGAEELLVDFIEQVDTLPVFARIAKAKSGRGANFRYLESDHKDATCACEVEEVNL